MANTSKLTINEREIVEAYEQGDEFKSVLTPQIREMHIDAARRTFKKDKRINIRMTAKDLELLQERALVEGIPYQTLMSSVLHKFVSGRLRERDPS